MSNTRSAAGTASQAVLLLIARLGFAAILLRIVALLLAALAVEIIALGLRGYGVLGPMPGAIAH